MSNDSPELDQPAAPALELSTAVAAKHVRRMVPVMKDGKPTGETRPVLVKTEEVFAHTLRDGLVTVVTNDGQKFTAELDPKLVPKGKAE